MAEVVQVLESIMIGNWVTLVRGTIDSFHSTLVN